MWFKERIQAPGPTPIPDASRQKMAEKPGYHRTGQFSNVIENVVSHLQRLLGVDWPVLPLASSGTGAMEMAVQNALGPGDRALVVGGGKFAERWQRMATQVGADVVEVDVEWGKPADPDNVVDTLERTSDVDVVFGTMVETSTLVRHPVEDIGHSLSGRDELFVVDAITGAGAEPLHPAEFNADSVVLGAQKGLMGPPGLAFLAVNSDAIARANEIEVRTTYFDLVSAVERLKSDNQTPWTPPMQLLRAVESSLELLFEEGLSNVFDRHRFLAESCRAAIESLDLSVFAQQPAVAGTSIELPEDLQEEKLQSRIYDNYNCFIPGGQKDFEGELLRIGHLGHVDLFDLQQAIGALEHGLIDVGWPVEEGVGQATVSNRYRELTGG